MESFDFITGINEMITLLIEFLFGWLQMALDNAGSRI